MMIRKGQGEPGSLSVFLLPTVTRCDLYNAVMSEFLTYAEAAERLGVSRMQIWRLVRDGLLEAHPNPLDRREKLIEVNALKKLEAQGRKKPRE